MKNHLLLLLFFVFSVFNLTGQSLNLSGAQHGDLYPDTLQVEETSPDPFNPSLQGVPEKSLPTSAAGEPSPSNGTQPFSLSSPSPNPAASFTTFNYSIPDEVKKAFLVVRDLTGRIVLEEPVDLQNNRLRLEVNDLSNGIFLYSLVLDGRPVVTRKLIVSR